MVRFKKGEKRNLEARWCSFDNLVAQQVGRLQEVTVSPRSSCSGDTSMPPQGSPSNGEMEEDEEFLGDPFDISPVPHRLGTHHEMDEQPGLLRRQPDEQRQHDSNMPSLLFNSTTTNSGLSAVVRSLTPLLDLAVINLEVIQRIDQLGRHSVDHHRKFKDAQASLLNIHRRATSLTQYVDSYRSPHISTPLNKRTCKAVRGAEYIGKLVDKLRKTSRKSALDSSLKQEASEMCMKLKALVSKQKNEWQCIGRLKESMAMAREIKDVLQFVCHLTTMLHRETNVICRYFDRPPPYEYTEGNNGIREDDNGCEMLSTSQNEWRQEHPIKSNSDITVDEPFDNPSFNLRKDKHESDQSCSPESQKPKVSPSKKQNLSDEPVVEIDIIDSIANNPGNPVFSESKESHQTNQLSDAMSNKCTCQQTSTELCKYCLDEIKMGNFNHNMGGNQSVHQNRLRSSNADNMSRLESRSETSVSSYDTSDMQDLSDNIHSKTINNQGKATKKKRHLSPPVNPPNGITYTTRAATGLQSMPEQLVLDISPSQKLEFVTSPPKILNTKRQLRKRFYSTRSLPENTIQRAFRFSPVRMQHGQQSEVEDFTDFTASFVDSQYSLCADSGDCFSTPSTKNVPGYYPTESNTGYTSSSLTSCATAPHKPTCAIASQKPSSVVSKESIRSSAVDPPWYDSTLLARFINSVADKISPERSRSSNPRSSSNSCSCSCSCSSSSRSNSITMANTRSSRFDTFVAASSNKQHHVAKMNRSRSNSSSRFFPNILSSHHRSRSNSRSRPFSPISTSSSVLPFTIGGNRIIYQKGSKRGRHTLPKRQRNRPAVDKLNPVSNVDGGVEEGLSRYSKSSKGSKRSRKDISFEMSSKHKIHSKTKLKRHKSAPISTNCGQCRVYCFKCKCPKRKTQSLRCDSNEIRFGNGPVKINLSSKRSRSAPQKTPEHSRASSTSNIVMQSYSGASSSPPRSSSPPHSSSPPRNAPVEEFTSPSGSESRTSKEEISSGEEGLRDITEEPEPLVERSESSKHPSEPEQVFKDGREALIKQIDSDTGSECWFESPSGCCDFCCTWGKFILANLLMLLLLYLLYCIFFIECCDLQELHWITAVGNFINQKIRVIHHCPPPV